jgi:hypothetical protein
VFFFQKRRIVSKKYFFTFINFLNVKKVLEKVLETKRFWKQKGFGNKKVLEKNII